MEQYGQHHLDYLIGVDLGTMRTYERFRTEQTALDQFTSAGVRAMIGRAGLQEQKATRLDELMTRGGPARGMGWSYHCSRAGGRRLPGEAVRYWHD